MAVLQALWGLSLISFFVASVLALGNASYREAKNGSLTAQSGAIYESALNLAVLGLLDTRPNRLWRADGVWQTLKIDDLSVQIAIQDELGRIDLNHADGVTLIALLQSAGLDWTSASKLCDKILDWRDANPGRRLHGAKAAEYGAAGLAYLPREGPFQSVGELRLVMGMTDDLFRRVAPALTVFSARQYFDPQTAPREALLALPGMTPDKVDSTLRERMNRTGIFVPSASLGGRAFTVEISILQKNGHKQTKVFAIRLTNNASEPYWIIGGTNRSGLFEVGNETKQRLRNP